MHERAFEGVLFLFTICFYFVTGDKLDNLFRTYPRFNVGENSVTRITSVGMIRFRYPGFFAFLSFACLLSSFFSIVSSHVLSFFFFFF